MALVSLLAWPLQFISVAIAAGIAVRKYGLGPIWQQDSRGFLLTMWNVGSAGALATFSLWTLRPFWRKELVARKLMLAFFGADFVVGAANYVVDAVVAKAGTPPPNMK